MCLYYFVNRAYISFIYDYTFLQRHTHKHTDSDLYKHSTTLCIKRQKEFVPRDCIEIPHCSHFATKQGVSSVGLSFVYSSLNRYSIYVGGRQEDPWLAACDLYSFCILDNTHSGTHATTLLSYYLVQRLSGPLISRSHCHNQHIFRMDFPTTPQYGPPRQKERRQINIP